MKRIVKADEPVCSFCGRGDGTQLGPDMSPCQCPGPGENRVLKIDGVHVVIDWRTQHAAPFRDVPRSFTVVQYHEVSGDCMNGYAQMVGGSIPHGLDMLPGGTLYLGKTWAEAMENLGVKGEVVGGPVP